MMVRLPDDAMPEPPQTLLVRAIRERDEALEKIAELRKAQRGYEAYVNMLEAEVREWKAKFEHAYDAYMDLNNNEFAQACEDRNEALAEVRRLMEVIDNRNAYIEQIAADLTRKRDEARAEAERLKSELEFFRSTPADKAAGDILRGFIQERDEAIAQREALHLALLEAINVHPIIEEYPATKEALAGLEEGSDDATPPTT